MKKILVPTDFSQNAKKATDYALTLFDSKDAEFTLLNTFYIPYSVPDISYSVNDLSYENAKKLFEKEKIYSSGQGTVFPKGFLVGEIESFEPSGLYYAIKIKLALNIAELEYCYLI